MVLTNFIATSGDGYPIVSKYKNYHENGFVDADVFKTIVRK